MNMKMNMSFDMSASGIVLSTENHNDKHHGTLFEAVKKEKNGNVTWTVTSARDNCTKRISIITYKTRNCSVDAAAGPNKYIQP